jgi:Fe-S cluster biogenesis protein NfuA
LEGPLDLTLENVEAVLDEMRPYLISDGGNVKVNEIDGPIVRLELVGECGTCPSSTQTMKMGLERKLKELIPEISEVIQAIPEGPSLEREQVDKVLESVRPFLAVAGGSIEVMGIVGVGGSQPTVTLKMEGASSTLQSVKLEIAQRIQRHFMSPGLRVDWE